MTFPVAVAIQSLLVNHRARNKASTPIITQVRPSAATLAEVEEEWTPDVILGMVPITWRQTFPLVVQTATEVSQRVAVAVLNSRTGRLLSSTRSAAADGRVTRAVINLGVAGSAVISRGKLHREGRGVEAGARRMRSEG